MVKPLTARTLQETGTSSVNMDLMSAKGIKFKAVLSNFIPKTLLSSLSSVSCLEDDHTNREKPVRVNSTWMLTLSTLVLQELQEMTSWLLLETELMPSNQRWLSFHGSTWMTNTMPTNSGSLWETWRKLFAQHTTQQIVHQPVLEKVKFLFRTSRNDGIRRLKIPVTWRC